MNRRDLDAFAAHHGLSAAAIGTMLDVARARPAPAEIRQFVIRMLLLAGVLSLAAGVIFFIAANWKEIGVNGRFVIAQAVIVVSVGLALWKPPPQALGRYALLMAFIATGGLLALFGQTYQTGADVYELFLTWAVLGLPFLIAGQWSATCAAWLVVLNIALSLFFSLLPRGGWLWVLFGSTSRTSMPLLLLVPTVVNAALWALAEYAQRTQWSEVAPRWIGRLALAFAYAFLTWSAVYAVLQKPMSGGDFMALMVTAAFAIAVTLYTLRTRLDVFPLALTAGSLIVVSTCALGRHLELGDTGSFFMLAIWLVASSTISARILMPYVRDWRQQEDAA